MCVIGGGQAGLACGYWLRRRRLGYTILEAQEDCGGSWNDYHESLRLFSPAVYCSLPGMKFPGGRGRYPHRDEVIDYLRAYREKQALDVEHGVRVERVQKNGVFRIATNRGEVAARAVIAATGAYRLPKMARVPGMESARMRILHSIEYAIPIEFEGQRVCVVGGGNSAVQIACELAGVCEVMVAARRKITFLSQRLMGVDLCDWLHVTGLDYLRILPEGRQPILDRGRYKRALRSGNPSVWGMFDRIEGDRLVWADGTSEEVDTLIFATGYRPNLGFLRGLVGENDDPADQRSGVSRSVRGLYFMGLPNMRSSGSATLRGAARDSRVIVEKLARRLG